MIIDDVLTEAVAKLKHAAADNRHVEAAQMRLVNLDDVIQAAGVNWRDAREKVRVGSMSFLRGCLAEEDIVIPCGDGFLIIFASADAKEVTLQVEEIRRLLVEFYLGQEGLDRLQVQTARQTLPAKALHALAANELVIERRPAAPSTHQFRFVPVWSARKQIIAVYFCSPVVESEERRLYGYEEAFFESGAGEADDFLAVDLEALDIVEAHMRAPNSAELKPTLCVPLHASTMRRRAPRTIYLRRLGQFAPEHLRRVSVRISEIPRGTPFTTIADWVGQLRGKVRTILLQFHYTEPLPQRVEQTGASGAGFFAPRQFSSAADASLLRAHVRAWAMRLAQGRMIFFLDDLCGEASARRAVELGADLVSSLALWSCAQQPGEVRHAVLASHVRG